MQDTIARIRKFRDERDWKKFHDPKNLAASISIEAAELLELFQWMSGEEATRYAADNKERVMQETIAKVLKFRDERDWKQFHDPKSLASSICIEAAELLELFQWLTPDQARQQATDKRERVSEEIADVAIYLIELADITGIDLAQAIEAKLEKNAAKYPAVK